MGAFEGHIGTHVLSSQAPFRSVRHSRQRTSGRGRCANIHTDLIVEDVFVAARRNPKSEESDDWRKPVVI